MTLKELEEKGMIIDNIFLNPSFEEYLKTRKTEKDHGLWQHLDCDDFPVNILKTIKDQLGKGLDEYKDYLRVKIERWNKGHYLPPHGDMTVFGPFVTHLFYSIPPSIEPKCSILFAEEGREEFTEIKLRTGMLASFHTFPNNFMCAYSKLKSENDLYVISFTPCLDDNQCSNWKFKEIPRLDWEKLLV